MGLWIAQAHGCGGWPGHCGYGFVLTDDTLVERILQCSRQMSLVLRQTGNGDTGPAGHHGGNIVSVTAPR